MYRMSIRSMYCASIVLCLMFAMLATVSAQASERAWRLRVSHVSRSTITVKWERGSQSSEFNVYLKQEGEERVVFGTTNATSYRFRLLTPGETYTISVHDGAARLTISVTTKRKLDVEAPRHVDTPDTCRQLPPRIVVTGDMENTRCQVVDAAGVGRSELIERGVIDAVDVWNYVPEFVEVCFLNAGDMVLMDADYAPRMVMEMDTHQRDGMTCGMIDREGTVVLLEPAAPAAAPATVEQPAAVAAPATLPTFDAIPLTDCQIKLVSTLYLRAEPAGEIIGLVWLNSEVPAFEINGYWYKIEFEGVTGYISRYHREVLHGNCG